MEKVISSEERIRRAEEIYNRRRMQSGVRVSTSRVNTTTDKKYQLYKKLIIQLIIYFLIYFVFYLVKNSNYIFSKNFISKAKEFLSYDINFTNAYNLVINYYNDNIKTIFTNQKQEKNEDLKTNTQDNLTNTEVSEGGIGGGEDNKIAIKDVIKETAARPVVKLSQMEIDANAIKKETKLVLPLKGTVSSRYGLRKATSIVSGNHAGIDIAAKEGTVFVAAMSGKVVLASSEGSYGNHIFIQDKDIITVYAHCKKLYVKEGDTVKQGQKIGEVGTTGNATGPHLHVEIRKENRTVNPELVLSFA